MNEFLYLLQRNKKHIYTHLNLLFYCQCENQPDFELPPIRSTNKTKMEVNNCVGYFFCYHMGKNYLFPVTYLRIIELLH